MKPLVSPRFEEIFALRAFIIVGDPNAEFWVFLEEAFGHPLTSESYPVLGRIGGRNEVQYFLVHHVPDQFSVRVEKLSD
ncbi:hypothetical protein D3C76_948360 [compost metagenome]